MAKEYDFDDARSVMAPSRSMIPAVLHDVNELAIIPRGIRCNVAGNVVMRLIDDSADVTIAMVVGETLSVRPRFIRATGTTAGLHLLL